MGPRNVFFYLFPPDKFTFPQGGFPICSVRERNTSDMEGRKAQRKLFLFIRKKERPILSLRPIHWENGFKSPLGFGAKRKFLLEYGGKYLHPAQPGRHTFCSITGLQPSCRAGTSFVMKQRKQNSPAFRWTVPPKGAAAALVFPPGTLGKSLQVAPRFRCK